MLSVKGIVLSITLEPNQLDYTDYNHQEKDHTHDRYYGIHLGRHVLHLYIIV